MAELDTVQNYIDKVRTLMQDLIAPYRYSDADIVGNLNSAILEARKIRPDIWLSTFRGSLPSYSSATPTTVVAIEPMYRMAFVYYIAGYTQLRDDESVEDSRGMAFMQRFTKQLTTGEV